MRNKLAAVIIILSLGLLGIISVSCSALLDTESLQAGSPPDGQSKDLTQKPDGEEAPDGPAPDGPALDGPVLDGLPTEDVSPDVYSAALFPREGSADEERLALAASSEADKTLAFGFRWEDRPGRPTAVDLTLSSSESSGQSQPLFQVFERQGRPFARAGLKVVPLAPEVEYRVEVSVIHRGSDSRLRVELSPLCPGFPRQVLEVMEAEKLSSAKAFRLARTSAVNLRHLSPSWT